MPELQAIWEDYRSDRVQVIAVNLAESLDVVYPIAWIYDYLILMDIDYSTWDLYVQGGYVPLNYVIDDDENQTVVGWMEGYEDSTVRSWIDEAIRDSPKLFIDQFSVIDSLGNDDGRADPEETVELSVALINYPYFADADSVSLLLRTSDSNLVLVDSTSVISHIPAGSTGDNGHDPFRFEVSASSPHWSHFELVIGAQPNDYSRVDSFKILIGRPSLIVVDDDEGADYEKYYYDALDGLGILYDCSNWLRQDAYSEIQKYETVVWFTGNDSVTTLTQQDIDSLKSFLDNGGELFITGQDIGHDIGSDAFYSDYLHSGFVEDHSGDYSVLGVDGDPIGDGLVFSIRFGDGANNQTSPDVIRPTIDSDSSFYYRFGQGACAVRYNNFYKVVYLSFGFEAIQRFTERTQVMRNVLSWFGYPVTEMVENVEPLDDEPPVVRLSPNPFRDRTSIQYEVPPNEHVHIAIYNLLGQQIRILRDEPQAAGVHTAVWDRKDDHGNNVPAGVYLCRLRVGRFVCTRKMILLR